MGQHLLKLVASNTLVWTEVIHSPIAMAGVIPKPFVAADSSQKRPSIPSLQLKTILRAAARRPPVWRIGRQRNAPRQEVCFD